MNAEIKAKVAKIELMQYINERATQPEYKTSFSLFGHTFNFGCSKERKLLAACELNIAVDNNSDLNILFEKYEDELENDNLKSINRNLRVRQ